MEQKEQKELTQIDILSLSRNELTREILDLGEKAFRAKQIYEWLHVKKITDFSQMSNISVQLRERLSKKFCIKSLKIKKRLVSDMDCRMDRRWNPYSWNTGMGTAFVSLLRWGVKWAAVSARPPSRGL